MLRQSDVVEGVGTSAVMTPVSATVPQSEITTKLSNGCLLRSAVGELGELRAPTLH